MNLCKTAATSAKLLLAIFLISAPLSAQRRRPAAPKPQPPPQPTQPAPTLDTLIAADSYKIYGEVRGVGQLLRSSGLNDIFEPMMKVASPPKELKTVVKWLKSRGDELMSSRLIFAAWPSRPKLPDVLVVIEFSSAEEARKFEPQLRGFLTQLLPPPTLESSPAPDNAKGEDHVAKPKEAPPAASPYVLKQSGALLLLSDTPFTLKTLRPSASKLLAEDPNFRQVHDRFNSESVLLYFDILALEKEQQQRMRKMEEEQKKRIEAEAANSQKTEEEKAVSEEEMAPEILLEEPPAPAPVVTGSPEIGTELTVTTSPQSQAVLGGTDGGMSGNMNLTPMALSMLSSAFFAGQPKWPDAIGVAIAFDADSYVVRSLLVSGPDIKGNPIPFIPQLVAGPPLTPEAPSILPADTELLITASLDYPLIYAGVIKAVAHNFESSRSSSNQTIKETQPWSPFAAYEARLGIKIKEDLLPLLGNEIAFSIPVKTLGIGPVRPTPSSPKKAVDEEPAQKALLPFKLNPVIAISVRDREGVRALLPKIIDSMGFKGAGLLATTEKRDDTELVSYADALAYAFVGNSLVVSTDPKAIRHVVDSYLNHQTLGSDSVFMNYTRWQPRQVLGQVYISPALMDGYIDFAKDINSPANDTLRDLLTRLSPAAEPVTYAVSNEGPGPLHELHVPRNLVLMIIAGIATESNRPASATNEAIAQSALRMLASAEANFKETKGNGNFGTIEQLLEEGLIQKDLLEKYGYKIDLTVLGTRFEASAIPLEYGKTGKMSFFVDESAVIRGGDHGGGPATVADKPLE